VKFPLPTRPGNRWRSFNENIMRRLVVFILLLLTSISYAQCCIAESSINNVDSIVSFQFFLEKVMPWLVALIIGGLTLFITRNQIKASKESINKQIDSSMKIAQLEINVV